MPVTNEPTGFLGRLALTTGVPLTVAALLGFLNVWLLGDYRAVGVSLVSGVCSTLFTFVWL